MSSTIFGSLFFNLIRGKTKPLSSCAPKSARWICRPVTCDRDCQSPRFTLHVPRTPRYLFVCPASPQTSLLQTTLISAQHFQPPANNPSRHEVQNALRPPPLPPRTPQTPRLRPHRRPLSRPRHRRHHRRLLRHLRRPHQSLPLSRRKSPHKSSISAIRKETTPRWVSAVPKSRKCANSNPSKVSSRSQGQNPTTTDGDLPEDIRCLFITPDYPNHFGVSPLLGRWLIPSDAPPGQAPATVVVLSYRFWQRYFLGDPHVIGPHSRLDHVPYQVVGVMPPRFNWADSDVFRPVPLSQNPNDGTAVSLRIREDVTKAQAEAELQPLMEHIAQVRPTYFPVKFRVVSGWHDRLLERTTRSNALSTSRRRLVVAADRLRQRLDSLACARHRTPSRIRRARRHRCGPFTDSSPTVHRVSRRSRSLAPCSVCSSHGAAPRCSSISCRRFPSRWNPSSASTSLFYSSALRSLRPPQSFPVSGRLFRFRVRISQSFFKVARAASPVTCADAAHTAP